MLAKKLRIGLVSLVGTAAACVATARADAFSEYGPSGSFVLPASAPFDVLADGRLVTLVGADVYAEPAVGAHTFNRLGTLAGMDVAPYGAAFVRVSPDGTHLAVGNSGGASYANFQVGVFALGDLSGHWFGASHYDAEWIDNTYLALTAGGPAGPPSVVTALDTISDPAHPANPTLVADISGYSGGVTFDAAGNLYTGNSFTSGGPSETGWIKAFGRASWEAALSGGEPVDFEAAGTLIVDLLSAAALGFDAEGNLHVGGGDLFGGSDADYAGLVRGTAVAEALAGGGPIDPADPRQVRRFDPEPDNPYNYYDLNYNAVTGELYVRQGDTVYSYAVPEPGALLLAAGALLGLARRSVRRGAAARGRSMGDRAARRGWAVGLAVAGAVSGLADSPFATRVLDYSPAPGQFVNVPQFNDPSQALGPPIGGGHANPDNSKLVSLGGFGGSLALAFDHTVRDDPDNPLGLDAIVFGNATWVGGDPNRHWAECGVIEISRDVNGNGLADDPWYVIAGSQISDPAGQWQVQTWDDDLDDPTYPPLSPPANPAWIPPGHSGTWSTAGYRLPAGLFDVVVLENPNGPNATQEGIFGYADFGPVLLLGDLDGDNQIDNYDMAPADFYTVPDDPREVGLTPGSGGGDAFDIAWAVDPATGLPAGLDGFDFIRITGGVNYVHPLLGEISPEIGGVADVAPLRRPGDLNCDGRVNNFDITPFVRALSDPAGYEAAYPGCNRMNADVNGDGVANNFDITPFVHLLTGE